tara:strand:- start:1821 stop:3005 length:1185 start_codon:yes stop_codon:yes gene_type:complete
MYVYWGYENSGKSHILNYAIYNSMTLLHSKFSNFLKAKYKVNNRGMSPNGRLWMHYDSQKIMYYRKDEKFTSYSYSNTDIFKKLEFKALDAYINPVSNETAPGGIDYIPVYRNIYEKIPKKSYGVQQRVQYSSQVAKDRGKFQFQYRDAKKYLFTFTDEDRKKYMSDEYKGTDVQYRAFLESFMSNEIDNYKPIGYKFLNDNADEILDDVDIVITSCIDSFILPPPIGHEYGSAIMEFHYLLQKCGKKYLFPPNVLNKLKKANNIIAYKSDIFDCVLKQLDSFSHFTLHKLDESPVEVYKRDKNIIWDYLDHQLNQPVKIAKFLIKNDIPFKYFDLDTDNYNEVFGGDFEIDKEYTSHAPTWVGFEDRYNELANISKEYISIRNIAQPYTPPKL